MPATRQSYGGRRLSADMPRQGMILDLETLGVALLAKQLDTKLEPVSESRTRDQAGGTAILRPAPIKLSGTPHAAGAAGR